MKKKLGSIFLLLVSAVAGAVVGVERTRKTAEDKIKAARRLSDKHLNLFLMMNQWTKCKQEGKQLSSYLVENGYNRIAVYGISYAGETLIDELKSSSVVIAYGIDQKADSMYVDIDICSVEDDLEEVDAVVVTAVTFFDEIKEKLSKKLKCPILSLEDILYEL